MLPNKSVIYVLDLYSVYLSVSCLKKKVGIFYHVKDVFCLSPPGAASHLLLSTP